MWIVYGETGEFDSFQEWTVAVYDNEAEAQRHARLATMHAFKHEKNPYDTDMVWFDRVRYGVYSAPFLKTAEEYITPTLPPLL